MNSNSLKGCNLLPALLDDSEEMQKDAESRTNTAPHDQFTITRCVKAAGHRIMHPSFCVCVFICSHEGVSFPHIMANHTVSGRDICLADLVINEMAIVATQASTLIISM